MGLFSNILEKLGIGTAHAHAAPDVRPYGPKTVPAGSTSPAAPAATATPGSAPTAAAAAKPTAMSEVDVVSELEKRADSHAEPLNWRTSIVDLLKLLDMDSSLSERKALATELGAPANLMNDSARMNMWLHKEVLNRIAANGGNVPANMLD